MLVASIRLFSRSVKSFAFNAALIFSLIFSSMFNLLKAVPNHLLYGAYVSLYKKHNLINLSAIFAQIICEPISSLTSPQRLTKACSDEIISHCDAIRYNLTSSG